MDLEFISRVLARLQPFVRDHVIRRTRVERVLATLQDPPEGLRAEVQRLLAKAGISIEEDLTPVAEDPQLVLETEDGMFEAPTTPEDFAESLVVLHGHVEIAIAAARWRMSRDRFINNHARVLLKSEEEVGLAILMRSVTDKPLGQGDFVRLTGEARTAAECLLLHNQGLVHFVAQRYAPTGMTYDDLFQHGMVGLIRAVELFDPALGNKFSTYAMNWIRQAITRGIANESRMIRLPVYMYERVQKVWQTRSRLTVDGEAPSVHQLALACELSVGQVSECLALGPQDILSLDAPVGPEGEMTLGDLYDSADPDAGPEHEFEIALLREQLRAVLNTLGERQASIIAMRFGLSNGEPKTLDEIGRTFGVTRERIRQIEKKAMTQLRDPSRNLILRPYLYESDDLPKVQSETCQENATTVVE